MGDTGAAAMRPATVASTAGEHPVPAGPVVEVNSLSIDFRAPNREPGQLRRPLNRVVDDVSFTIAERTVTALIGASGSGKTTTSLAVAGVGTITSGTIRVIDEVLTPRQPRLRRRRADVQMILQDPYGSLDPRQSVRSGFNELRRLHSDRTGWTSAADLLDLVKLPAITLDRYPHELSGGQLQRVSIARALYPRPALLIADEPTSALDVSTQTQLLDLLVSIRDDVGVTLLFVTHDIAVVDHVADNVLVLQSGRVVEHGDRQTVLRHPTDPYTIALLDALPGRQLAELRSGR